MLEATAQSWRPRHFCWENDTNIAEGALHAEVGERAGKGSFFYNLGIIFYTGNDSCMLLRDIRPLKEPNFRYTHDPLSKHAYPVNPVT